jgi:DNA (cytosine-5)-methyltransferase 1
MMSAMRKKYKALDCCCCIGGMSEGLHRAGFEVVGVDIVHHACYRFPLILRDFRRLTYADLSEYDYIHLSPPCQGSSRGSALARSRGKVYPDLIPAARRLAVASGLPYTIENVVGSALKGIRLYGDMFGLPILRERIFESNIPLSNDIPRTPGRIITVAGSHARAGENWRRAMGINWKAPDYLIKEAVPPAYGEYIGRQVIDWLNHHPASPHNPPGYHEVVEVYEEPGAYEQPAEHEEPPECEKRR